MKQESITPAPTIVRGYKVFTPEFKAKQGGFQYAENTEYTHKGKIQICSSGFHFCIKAAHCFSYYDFNPNYIVCEVEGRGEIQTHNEDSKICTDILFVGRRLTWAEVLAVANEGKDNTGHSNSGYRNSGNWNSGDRNSGDSNSGDRNSGNSNSGDRNSGNSNSGDRNNGNRNSGDRNSGDSNSGYRNSGNWNSGDRNSGNWNSGNRNSGDSNSGYRNSGNRNSGNWNSGYGNSGYRNSGDSNSGNRNSGYRNSGDSNSGNWNSGNRNSGDSNSGYRNSGAFCTDNNPYLILFNKPTKIKIKDWENHKAVEIMDRLDPTIWVPSTIMTGEEKKGNPKYETTEGYLKTIPYKEAWANLWGNLSDENKKIFTTLQNFDATVFEEITGIKTN